MRLPISKQGLLESIAGGLVIAAAAAIWQRYRPQDAPSVPDILPYAAAFVLGAATRLTTRCSDVWRIKKIVAAGFEAAAETLRGSPKPDSTSNLEPCPPDSVRVLCEYVERVSLPWNVFEETLFVGVMGPYYKHQDGPIPQEGPMLAVVGLSIESTLRTSVRDATLEIVAEPSFTYFVTELPRPYDGTNYTDLIGDGRQSIELPLGDLVGGSHVSKRVLLAYVGYRNVQSYKWWLKDPMNTEIRSGSFTVHLPRWTRPRDHPTTAHKPS
jgi:hypothetical protein